MFTSREKKHLIISILILGLAFGFNDRQPVFTLLSWSLNFAKSLLSAAIILLIYEVTHKLVAKKYGVTTEYEIWSVKRHGHKSSLKPQKFLGFNLNSYPLGSIISIITTLLSNGLVHITPIASFKVVEQPSIMLTSKFKHLRNFDEAKIAASPLIILAALALVLTALNKNLIFNQMPLMIFIFIAYSLIPVSTLDGSKIAFGSIPLYIAVLAAILTSYLLIESLNIFLVIILAVIAAFVLVMLYLKKY